MTARTAIGAAAARLAAVSPTPRLDAELLMAHAFGCAREELLLGRMEEAAPPAFEALVERRLAHEPVAYIVGRRGFWTIELEVGPGVLVPRPDSETLIEAAVDHFGGGGPRTVLDLGTGPGTLLLAALDQWPEARGIGTDRSETALVFARRNTGRLGLSGRAELRAGDWTEGLDGKFDLILCNPPYVAQGSPLGEEVRRWEPAEALFAGPDGLDEYRRLAPRLPSLIAEGGLACFEIGQGQAEQVGHLFEAEGLRLAFRKDLAGIVRCLVLTLDPG